MGARNWAGWAIGAWLIGPGLAWQASAAARDGDPSGEAAASEETDRRAGRARRGEGSGEPGNGGEAIVVIGEKVPRPLAATTASVAVLEAGTIAARGHRQLSDVVARTPNLAPVFGGAGFAIRGIANIGVSNAGEAATANVYLDDIPLAPTYLHAAPTDLWDVRQLEVWRGPQSTLRGQNALAGAVIIDTADPALEQAAFEARASLSDEAERRLSLAGSVPVVAGKLGARLSLDTSRCDGFIRNLTRQARDDAEARNSLRAKLLWRPAGEDVSLKVGYHRLRRRGGAFAVYARTDRPDFKDRRVATDNVANRTDLDFDGVSFDARWRLADGVTLVGTTTWSEANERSSLDGDFSPANLAYTAQRRDYETWTQELRLTYEKGAAGGVAGLYLFDRDLASRTQSRTLVPTPVGTIAALLRGGGLPAAQADAIAAAYGAALPAIPVDFDGSFPTKVRTMAVFGDLKLPIAGRLSLLAGLRLERYLGDNGTIQQARFAGRFPDPAAFGPLGPVIAQINSAVAGFVGQANGNVPSAKRRLTALLPKAGLSMAWNDDISTAFVAQRAYRPGGLSVNIARGLPVPYGSEFAWNYELSLRARLAGGRLVMRANAFANRWRNQQVTVNFGLNSFDTNVVNAGRSRLYGFELDARLALSRGWSLHAGVGHAHTRFGRFSVAALGRVSDLSGKRFAFAPRWTLAGGVDFTLDSGLAGSLSASRASRAYGAVGANQRDYPIAAHTLVDARFGYDEGRFAAFVSARNLFDRTHVAYKSPSESRAVLSAPREIAIEARLRY